MTNLPDDGYDSENQGMPLGELPIQIESAALHILSTFLEYPPDALIVVDEAGTIALVNTQAETLFGYDHGELPGQTVERLLPEQLHATHMAKRTRYMQAAHTQPMSLNLDLLVGRRKDGSHFPVEISLRPLRIEQRLHVMAAIRDMTVQREIEQEAHAEADERLRAFQLILDHITSGIFLEQGPHLRLLLANRAATALWGAEWPRGQPKEAFFRQHAIQLFTPNGHQLAPDEWGSKLALNTGKPVLRRQLVICRADHTCFPVLVDAIPLGNLPWLSRLLRGITPRPSEEEPVVLMIYQDVSAIKEAEALKDQFISLAAHELRTPLTIISGYADRLLSRSAQEKGHGLDEWQQEKVQGMKQAAWQLVELTEDLLDLTRMQSGQFQLERHATDLIELTQKVIKRLQATTDQHQIAFHSTAAHLWATVDAIRIEQVLSNLLSNAIKYSPGGGPIEVTLEEHAEPHEAHFRIHDQGMGIPPDQHAHIFERFVRGENVRVAGIRGTGLGLYLCRELLERHGGQISFESKQDVGSTFFFSLPAM